MYFTFDNSFVNDLLATPPDQMLLKIFFLGGWIPFGIVFLWGAKMLWLEYINGQWFSEQKFLLLAIDIPRGNAETLRSVENMFTYLAGAHSTNNLIDIYWIGKFQLGFSFEIVSIDGYTQFLVYTPATFKNLVESAIYSVYPDAEISEVNDYTENVPNKFPDKDFDLWGAEFILVRPEAFPIKTYPAFEDKTSAPEAVFKDPLASLMDLNSSLRVGEQLWYQILVVPTDFEWVKKTDEEVAKILKEKIPVKRGFLDNIIDVVIGGLSEIISLLALAWSGEPAEKKEEKKDESLKMMNLKPKEKKQIESIQIKASKLGFSCKIRMVYIAKKDVINKPKAVNGFVGYMKQFIDMDLNNFKPDMDKTATTASYFFKQSKIAEKQNKIMAGYQKRSGTRGRLKKILNIEELATLWHFPIEAVVRAPLIQKAPGRKSEPPMSLPLEENYYEERSVGSIPDINIFEDEDLTNSENTSVQKSYTEERTSTKKTLPDFFIDEGEATNEAQKNEGPGNIPFV